jgi:hypothetical protein
MGLSSTIVACMSILVYRLSHTKVHTMRNNLPSIQQKQLCGAWTGHSIMR